MVEGEDLPVQPILPDVQANDNENIFLLKNEIKKASEIGRLVIQTAGERQNPKYLRGRYSMPMLDQQQFPKAAVELVTGNYTNADSQAAVDARVVRGASVALVIEASAQIVEARNRSTAVAEHSDSLEQVLRMTRAGAQLLKEMESADRDIIIAAAKPAFTKRHGGQANAGKISDEQILDWTRRMSAGANQRIARLLETVKAYSWR